MSQKKENYTFFRDGGKYLFATGESPKGMGAVLAVVWEGQDPANLRENVKPVKELQALERVEPDSIPLEWWNGFAKATGRLSERKVPDTTRAAQEEIEPLAQIVLLSLVIAIVLGLWIFS